METNTQAPDEADAFELWMEANPLRVWRHESGTSILATASKIKASMTSVQMWERGVHVPGAGHMANIAAVMNDPEVHGKWTQWKNRQPE